MLAASEHLFCLIDKEGWQYLFPVKDASLRSRLALQFVDRWPLESCLEILAYCISDTAVQEGLKCELQRKLAELQVYQKVWALASRERKWASHSMINPNLFSYDGEL